MTIQKYKVQKYFHTGWLAGMTIEDKTPIKHKVGDIYTDFTGNRIEILAVEPMKPYEI